MSIIYLDTTALVKQYVRERGSDAVRQQIGAASLIGTVLITQAEMAAALAKAQRMQWVTPLDARKAWEGLLTDWPSLVTVEVTSQLVTLAGDLAWRYHLRGYDAVHLSAALVWKDILNSAMTMGTFDRELWDAAAHVGLSVWPENLDDFK